MNPLDRHPEVRRVAYYVQFVVAGAILLIGVGYAAVPDATLPGWYAVAAAVSSALWAYLGLTAAHNVPSYQDVVEGDAPPPDDAGPQHLDRGAVDVGTAVLVAILVVVLLIFLGVGFEAR